ncbi:MAG: glycosyltransferase [Desulfosarcinaceae bacterium]|nr:glycosyltransferase [Desulfosarcinaceae bacterium]
MSEYFTALAACIYFGAALGLMCYGVNCYALLFLFWRGRARAAARLSAYPKAASSPADLPVVTTQIAIYNEINVAERVMRAACAMDYPQGRHEIQVLDDSIDETRSVVDRVATDLRSAGHDIQVLRRPHRKGFKAGALSEGLAAARGELVAVFDADFVPPSDFLLRSAPFFRFEERLGLVQARWGHLNRRDSLLTRAQAIGIDGHFMVEQAARSWNRLYMNFNGTAGLWRRSAIDAAGGWQWDTLTEDMDLSYRMQFAGWTTLYLPDLVVPAEIPDTIGAFKSQQFRWAKGSTQTALKLLPTLWRQPVPIFQKLQAFFHMTHYFVHPLMLTLALLALPVLLTLRLELAPLLFALLAAALAISILGPNALYVTSQLAAYGDGWRRVLWMPCLVMVGVGLAVSNTRAVLEALLRVPSGFVRTPKRGERELKRYRLSVSPLALVEILLGLWCAAAFGVYLAAGKYLVGPFLAVYTAGYLFVGLLTLLEGAQPLQATLRRPLHWPIGHFRWRPRGALPERPPRRSLPWLLRWWPPRPRRK